MAKLVRVLSKMDSLLSNCEIVKELEQSGRDGVLATEKCSADEARFVENNYKACWQGKVLEMKKSLTVQKTANGLQDRYEHL